MQRVTNCILSIQDHVLLLKKPRRGWYAIPGGKMEHGETVKESVEREYWEETNLQIVDPQLIGIFSFFIYSDKREFITEWMMFTFKSEAYTGTLASYCEEGDLEWVHKKKIKKLPMAEGDLSIFEHVLSSDRILYGTFSYTEDYKLIRAEID